jgi:hypothetical protein
MELILATDMTKHGSVIDQLKEKVQTIKLLCAVREHPSAYSLDLICSCK